MNARRSASTVIGFGVVGLLPLLVAGQCADPGRLEFTQHPANVSVPPGATATFSVAVETDFPDIVIAWSRADGSGAAFAPIDGVSGTTLSVGPVTIDDDDGARFRATATPYDSSGIEMTDRSRVSNEAVLSVVPVAGEYRYVRITQTSDEPGNVAVDGMLLYRSGGDGFFLSQVHVAPDGEPDGPVASRVLGVAQKQCEGLPRADWDASTFTPLLGEGSQLIASFDDLEVIEEGNQLTVFVCADHDSATWTLEVGKSVDAPDDQWVGIISGQYQTATVTVPKLKVQ